MTMPIRLKILLACVALTAVTVLMGSFSHRAQRQLGIVAVSLYDDTFLAMSYLRSAESKLVRAEARHLDDLALRDHQAAAALFTATLADIKADLEVATQRAMSEAGKLASERLSVEVSDLESMFVARMDHPAAPRDIIRQLENSFETVIEIYAADGYEQRTAAGAIVERIGLQTRWMIGLAVAAALAIGVVLARSIVPTMHHAVRIAKSVAGGTLDNEIRVPPRRWGEAAQLLQALDVMQASIRDAMGRIHRLMEEQASYHASEAAAQHVRFEAALSNMVQGLCLFDATGRLAVFNRRFAEMFGTREIGAEAGDVFPDVSTAGLLRTPGSDAGYLTAALPDGRFIAVSHCILVDGGWVTTYEDISERIQAEAHIAHLALHDSLTGLPNRVALREHLSRALPVLPNEKLAVLCLDLDRFKIVNDTLGHMVGDALLQAVAERLGACVRKTDLVVRQGGDEFLIVQRYRSGSDEAEALAQRIITVLAEPFNIDGHRLSIGTSIGIAFADQATQSGETLLNSADLAMYRAKAEGGSRFRLFEAAMDEEMRVRRHLELDLRTALINDEFELFYQPLVNARDGTATGFEALLRWRHPKRGMVPPVVFIPVAEEIGLINDIGAWVINQACQDAASWPGGLKVAVNLSPLQFQDTSLPGIVSAALISSQLNAGCLELEITESLLLQDDQMVLQILHDLKGMGARIAMDDFGTGYSSLSYLRRFPFDKIKIDQSFIRGLSGADDCTAIVRAVISLGQSMGMTVNAEGVETAQQLATLQHEGCGEVQGYFFSKPRPASDVVAMLQDLASLDFADESAGVPLYSIEN